MANPATSRTIVMTTFLDIRWATVWFAPDGWKRAWPAMIADAPGQVNATWTKAPFALGLRRGSRFQDRPAGARAGGFSCGRLDSGSAGITLCARQYVYAFSNQLRWRHSQH